MPIANTPERYGTLAVALHWIAALLIAALLAVGFYMVSLPEAGFDKAKILLILYHKELGVLVLLLAAARLAWRLAWPLPRLEPGPDAQRIAARVVALWLYVLMLALPLTGWIMSSAAAMPVSFFGVGFLPDLVQRDDFLFRAMRRAHEWLAWTLVALLVLHVGAALWHHFVKRDRTLAHMLPPKPSRLGPR